MKTRKLISILLTPIMMLAITISCSDDEGVSYSMTDVSSRISGFGSTVTGAGASFTINGSQMDKVLRVAIGNAVVAARLFTTVSESSLTFTVPLSATLGTNQVMLVFPGSERAFSSIEVIPFQAISSFVPYSANTGETVTILGANLNIVDEVKLGSVLATITSQTATALKFTVPAGITTGKITLVSEAGSANSAADLTACAGSSTGDCLPGINLNMSFELGTGDTFTNWNKFNGGTLMPATTNVEGGEVFRGARGLKVIRDNTLNANDHWRIQLASDYVPTDNGASYTVYAWVRATTSSGAATAFPNATTMRFSNQDAAQYGPNTTVPTTWTRISWQFTSNATQKRIVLDMNGGGPVTNFFIDDVKLIKN